MKSHYYSNLNLLKNLKGIESAKNSKESSPSINHKVEEQFKNKKKFNKPKRRRIQSSNQLEYLTRSKIENINEEEEKHLKFSKIIEKSNNFANNHTHNPVLNPKLKKNYVRIEKLITLYKKTFEEQNISIQENLPFKKDTIDLQYNLIKNLSDYSKSAESIKNSDANVNQIRKSFDQLDIFNQNNSNSNNVTSLNKVNNLLLTENNYEFKEGNTNDSIEKFSHENESRIHSKFQEMNDKNPKISNDVNYNIRPLNKFNNVYDSFSDEDIEEIFKEVDTYTIDIKGKFKLYWEIIKLILIVYSIIITPFLFAFYLQKSNIFKGIQLIMDVFFTLDILIKFFSEYFDENETIIINYEKIFLNYLTGNFLFDFMTAIPFLAIRFFRYGWRNLFNNYFNYSTEGIFNWLKVFKLIELINSYRFINLKLSNDSKINRVLKSAIVFICLAHISACLWIYLGRCELNIDKNWINSISLQDSSFIDIYIASFYFNLVTIYTIGYGDILASNDLEYIYCIFLLIFGVMLFSFGISSLSTLFGSFDTRTSIYNAKCLVLDIIDEEYLLDNEIYDNIKTYLNYELKKNNNDVFELLESLPTHVKNELTIYMYRILIKDLKFFKGQSLEFILFVLPLIKSQKVIKGMVLLSAGQFMEEMYLVVNGCLGIYLDSYFDNLEIGTIKENCHYGELLMQINEKSPYQIRCKSSNAEILILKREDFIKIKNSFKKNIISILKESYLTLEIIDKRRQQFLQLYKYENCIFGVKRIMKELNMYLMERDFDEYYYLDKELEDANDFILNHDFENISKILYEYTKNKKNSSNRFNKKLETIIQIYSRSRKNTNHHKKKDERIEISEKDNTIRNESLDRLQINSPNLINLKNCKKGNSTILQEIVELNDDLGNFTDKNKEGNLLTFKGNNLHLNDKSIIKDSNMKINEDILSEIAIKHLDLKNIQDKRFQSFNIANNPLKSITNESIKKDRFAYRKTFDNINLNSKKRRLSMKRSKTIMKNFKQKVFHDPNLDQLKADNELDELSMKTMNLLNSKIIPKKNKPKSSKEQDFFIEKMKSKNLSNYSFIEDKHNNNYVNKSSHQIKSNLTNKTREKTTLENFEITSTIIVEILQNRPISLLDSNNSLSIKKFHDLFVENDNNMKFQISHINQKGFKSEFTNLIFQPTKTSVLQEKLMNFEESQGNNLERKNSLIYENKKNKQNNIPKTEDFYFVNSLEGNVRNIKKKNNLGYFRSLTIENHVKINKKSIGLKQNKILLNLKMNNNKLRKILLMLYQNKPKFLNDFNNLI